MEIQFIPFKISIVHHELLISSAVTWRVANFLPKLVGMLLGFLHGINWMSIFQNPYLIQWPVTHGVVENDIQSVRVEWRVCAQFQFFGHRNLDGLEISKEGRTSLWTFVLSSQGSVDLGMIVFHKMAVLKWLSLSGLALNVTKCVVNKLRRSVGDFAFLLFAKWQVSARVESGVIRAAERARWFFSELQFSRVGRTHLGGGVKDQRSCLRSLLLLLTRSWTPLLAFVPFQKLKRLNKENMFFFYLAFCVLLLKLLGLQNQALIQMRKFLSYNWHNTFHYRIKKAKQKLVLIIQENPCTKHEEYHTNLHQIRCLVLSRVFVSGHLSSHMQNSWWTTKQNTTLGFWFSRQNNTCLSITTTFQLKVRRVLAYWFIGQIIWLYAFWIWVSQSQQNIVIVNVSAISLVPSQMRLFSNTDSIFSHT